MRSGSRRLRFEAGARGGSAARGRRRERIERGGRLAEQQRATAGHRSHGQLSYARLGRPPPRASAARRGAGAGVSSAIRSGRDPPCSPASRPRDSAPGFAGCPRREQPQRSVRGPGGCALGVGEAMEGLDIALGYDRMADPAGHAPRARLTSCRRARCCRRAAAGLRASSPTTHARARGGTGTRGRGRRPEAS